MSSIPFNIPKITIGHNQILIVTGVHGSGKNHLLSRLARKRQIRSKVSIMEFGESLFTHLQAVYPNIKTRDDMRTMLTQDQVKQGVLDLVDWIIQNQPIILNTHVVYRQNNQLTSNSDIDRQFNAKGYVFVKTDPSQILQWRLKDTRRGRPKETIEEIAHHQDVALQTVTSLAQQLGSALVTIQNRKDNVAENVNTFLGLALWLIS